MRKVIRLYRVGVFSFSLVFMTFIFIGGSAFGADISTSNKAPVGYISIPGTVSPHSITPPSGYILEDEPACYDDYVDTSNGGCNSDPCVFETINCGDVILGTSGIYDYYGLERRDTDWFQVDVTEGSDITMQGMADFDVQFVIIDGRQGCPTVEIISIGTASAGENLTIQASNLPAGTYWLWVGPQWTGSVTCGTEYWFRASCVGTPIPTLSEWGMILFSIFMVIIGIVFIRRVRPRTV